MASFFLIVAVSMFALGVKLYLISISSTSWQGIDGGLTISLWKECCRLRITDEWICNSWHTIPDFVRSAQAFCIISLLCYVVCSVILVAAFVLKCLNRSKVALIVISLLTFTSACMIAMAVVVMGVKGKDHLMEMKQSSEKLFEYFLKGCSISGAYYMGWAIILAIVASLVNFISFIFFLLEYKDMTDSPRPTKV